MYVGEGGGGHKGGSGVNMFYFSLASGLTSTIFDHFTSCLGMIFNSVMLLFIGGGGGLVP